MIRRQALRAASVACLLLLLLAPTACFRGPAAPVAASDGGDPVLDEAWAPDLVGIDIEPQLGDLRFDLRLDSGDQLSLHPLVASSTGRTWTFQLGLDVDQNDATGDAWGSEFLVVPAPQSRALLLRYDGSGWQRAASAPLEVAGDQLSFSFTSAALAEQDGWIDYLLDLFVVEGGNEEPPMELVTRHTGTNRPDEMLASQVPVITHLRAKGQDDDLQVRGRIAPRERRHGCFYDPYRAGGWQLQLFVNTDQAATGYWLGFEYLVRGSEWSDGSFVVRRIEPGDQYPGGWGPESGRCEFSQRWQDLTLTCPISALGGDDGRLDYAFETYATVPCSGCPGGVGADYSATYFGSTVRRGHPVAQMPVAPAGIMLARVLPPRPGSTGRAAGRGRTLPTF